MPAINLGGEGEVPGVLNQQPEWVQNDPNWFAARGGNRTLADLIADGHQFLFCPNLPLALADESFDTVYTNSVPLDRTTTRGPGVQSAEIRRILIPGGKWVHTDAYGTVTVWVKPL